VGRETALCNTIGILKDASQQTFFNIVKSRGEKLQRYPPLVPADLSPPAAVREGISVVVELIQSYNSIMLPHPAPKPHFLPVVSSLLDPIVQVSLSLSFFPPP
jgi:conserved oligomeric Golgi complex subunit 6